MFIWMLLLLPSQEPNHFDLKLQLYLLQIICLLCLLLIELKFEIPLLGLNLLLFFRSSLDWICNRWPSIRSELRLTNCCTSDGRRNLFALLASLGVPQLLEEVVVMLSAPPIADFLFLHHDLLIFCEHSKGGIPQKIGICHIVGLFLATDAPAALQSDITLEYVSYKSSSADASSPCLPAPGLLSLQNEMGPNLLLS
jgi:hypothetical protein